MNMDIIIAVIIFVVTYGLIISEKFHRASIALLGAFAMLAFHIETQEKAVEHIDFNTIGLLIGMMIIVTIMKKSGIFEYMAIRAAKLAKGDPWRIVVFFCIITAVASALLDNVTTIMLIVPVTLVITDALGLNPIPFLIPEVLIANIGGTATLIGDPPNIMIGSAAKIGFMDFIINLSPVVIVIFVVTMLLLKVIYKNAYTCDEQKKRYVLKMREDLAIRDMTLLKKCLWVMGGVVLGFALHQSFGYESATVAMFGAAILLVISKVDPEDIFLEIEWPTIFFFASLFILVGVLEEVGVIEYFAKQLIAFTAGSPLMTMMLILWGAAIASAFLDNIPFVATMIPLIKSIVLLTGMEAMPLWWALSLGACLGGNGTLVGASANVIVSGMLEKQGRKIGFFQYMKIAFPLMIVSIVLSSGYLYIKYFVM
jgi:Na+/H+ antiporter NhaD/arsenite permease-like protein